MIKLKLRGKRRIRNTIRFGTGESLVNFYACFFCHRAEQGDHIFAIAVLVREHLGNSMRLVAADANLHGDIPHIISYPLINTAHLFLVILGVPNQIRSQFPDIVVYLFPGLHQPMVPLGHIRPLSYSDGCQRQLLYEIIQWRHTHFVYNRIDIAHLPFVGGIKAGGSIDNLWLSLYSVSTVV